jgi:hypothetical protein
MFIVLVLILLYLGGWERCPPPREQAVPGTSHNGAPRFYATTRAFDVTAGCWPWGKANPL